MSTFASVDLDSGPVTLYYINGWLKEEVRPLKGCAGIGFVIAFAWALSWSPTTVADVLWAGTVVVVVPCFFIAPILHMRGIRIIVDENGLRHDNKRIPSWLRPLAQPWSIRWEDLVSVDTFRRTTGAGKTRDTTIDMCFVLRDGQKIKVRPHFWLPASGIDEQPSLQTVRWLPVAAMPIGQAVRKWAPQARENNSA
jgi:hypothetical protein